MVKKNNKTNKIKGFSLTELLAVIVIIAVIAFISIPLISSILKRTKKSTFTRNIENITKTIELYIYDQNEGKLKDITTFNVSPDGIIKSTDDTSLQHEGEIGGIGQIIVDKKGRYNIYYTDKEFCATKGFEDSKMSVTNGDCSDIENKNITFVFSDDTNPIYVQKGSNYLLPEVTVYTITGEKINNVSIFISRINNDGTIINDAEFNTNVPIGTKYEITYLANKDEQTASKKITIIISDLTKAYISNVSATATTNSINTYFSAYDEDSGIKQIEYILYHDNQMVDSYKENINTLNTMTSTNFNHEFSGLRENTDYKVVIKITNGTDIVTEASKEVKTYTINKPTIVVIPSDYSQKKKVTISYPNGDNLKYKYIIGTASATTLPAGENEVTFDVDRNTAVSATITDGTNTISAVTNNITKIDSTAPEKVTLSIINTASNEVKVVVVANDKQSGIYGYQFSKDGGTTWYPEEPQESNTYTFNNLDIDSYQFVAKVFNGTYDKYGFTEEFGTKKSNVINKTMKTCSLPTYNVLPDNINWTQAKEITIDYGNDSNCRGEYSLDSGLTWQTGTNVTIKDNNHIIVAKNTDENNVAVASSIIINKIDTTAPTNVSFSIVKTTRAITVTAVASDSQSGIARYAFSKDDGKTWTDWQISNVYKFDGLTTNTYKIKVKVYNLAYHQTANDLKNDSQGITTTSATNVTLDSCAKPTYNYPNSDGSTWTQGKVVNINYGNVAGCTGSYSLDGGTTWKTGTSVTFTANGSLVAKNTDGTNTVTASSENVTKIDTTAPVNVTFTTTQTTQSITITASATDNESGIAKYAFSKDNGTTWTSYQTGNKYTFDKLVTNTYNLKIKVTNNAYENTVSSLKVNAKGITISEVQGRTLSSCPTPTYGYANSNGSTWAQYKTLTINYGSVSGCTGSYSVDGGSTWKTGTSVTFNANGSLVAKNTDGTNTVTASAENVIKIDNSAPTESKHTTTKTTKSITVTATGTDSQSGIIRYAFSKDDGTTWSGWQTSNIYKFDNLTSGTYKIKSKVYNGTYGSYGATDAKGTLASATSSVTLDNCPKPTYSYANNNGSEWAQYKVVNINYGNVSGCTGSYSTDGGSTWKTGTSVTFNANGNVIAKNTDGTNTVTASSENVTKIDNSKPSASTHSYSKTTKSITVTATGTDSQTGISMYAFSKDDGKTWTTWQTSNIYKFDNLTSGTYKIKSKVYNGTYGSYGATEEKGALASTTSNITLDNCPKPTYSYANNEGSTWTQGKVVNINYGNVSGCTGSYSLDGGTTWKTGTSVTFKANGNVIAKNTDGTNTVTASSENVTKIDTTAPVNVTFTTTQTTQSITITASATDNESGIAKYAFSKDNGTTWTSYQTGNTYKFDKLVTNTYNIKIKVTNNAYENTVSNLKVEAKGITISGVQGKTLASCPTPTYGYANSNGSTWAQYKTLTINYGSVSGCTGSYSTDGGSTWKTGTSVTFNANGSLVAKNTDGTNTVTASAETVTKIDNSAPTASTHTTTKTTKSITVTAKGTDSQSGIIRYAFSKDDGTTWSGWQTSNIYKFDNLTSGTYKIKSKVYNGTYGSYGATDAKGTLASATSNVTLDNCPKPTYSYTNNDGASWTQSKVIAINYGNVAGCTGSYSTDGGSTWKTGTSVTFTSNGSLVAKNTDGTNTVTASSENVTKIDTSAPTASTHSYSKTTKSIKVTATGTDSQSGIIRYAFSKDDGKTWSGWQTSNIYTFDNLTSGTYKIKSKVYNGTYGSTGATEEKGALASATSSVTLDNCPKPTYSYANSDGSTWTQGKVVNINYGNVAGCTGSYSTDGGSTWKTGTSVTFTSNGSLVAKNTDGTNTVTASSENVTKIDTTAPVNVTFTTTQTTQSITITASATDNESGIAKYAFSKDNGTTWTSYQTGNTYKFDKLVTNTYNIKIKVTNNAYENTVSSLKVDAKGITISGVQGKTLASCPTPTYGYANSNGSTWAQYKTLTINYGSTVGCTGSYSTDGGSTWKTGTSVTFNANGSLVAKNTDGTNTVTASAENVTKIDNSAPTASSHTTTKTTKSITVTAKGTDSQSGIIRYAFSKDDGSTWSGWQTSNIYKFDNLTSGTYKIKSKVYNGTYGSYGATDAKGTLTSSTSNVTLDNCPKPTYSYANNNGASWTQYKVVNINYGNVAGCTGSYSTDGGSTWKTGTSVTFTSNGSLVAKNTDGTNTVTASSENVTKIDNSKPSASTHTYVKTTKAITITASGTDSQSGIIIYAFSKDDGVTWTAWQTSNTYTFNNLKSGTYKIKSKVYNGTYGSTGATEEKGALASATSSVTLDNCPKPTYSYANSDGSTWTQGKVVNINYGNVAGCTGSYSLDGGTTWKTGTSVTFTANGNVVAKNTDGTNTVTASSENVTKIDTTAPVNVTFTTTQTTQSITITASATDNESGIAKYAFSKDNGTTWSSYQTGNTYKFDKLVTNTYNIKIKVKNNAYENTVSNLKVDAKGITISGVQGKTLASCPTPTYGYANSNGSTWAQYKTLTINYGSVSGCTGSYSTDGGSTWKTGTSVTFNANGSLVAKNTDGTNTVTASAENVTKIDNSAPTASSHTTTKTTKSITVTATGTDSQSGIIRYAFSKDDGTTWSGWQTSNIYTFDNLTSGTYKIKSKVYNGTYGSYGATEAKGTLTSSTSNVTLDNCPKPTYSYTNNDADRWTQSKVIAIDYGSVPGCSGSYSLDGGSTWKTGTSVTMTENNGTVVAKNTDGKNTVTASAITVIKIDRTKVDKISLRTSKTSKSITATVDASDAQSGVARYSFRYKLKSSSTWQNWTSWQTGVSYTFNDLVSGSYDVQAKAYNGTYGSSGATETLAVADTSVDVTIDGCGIPTISVAPSGSVWSQYKKVTINYNSPSGYIGYYSIDGGSTWIQGDSFTTTTNGQSIVARATDGVNTCTSSSAVTISYLDPTKPDTSTHTYTKTTKSITVTASGTDKQSGIKMYSFKINDGAWSNWQTSNQYNFDNLSTGTYKIQSKVYNGTYGSAGATEEKGVLTSSPSTVSLDACPMPTYSVSAVNSYGWAQYRTVTINYGNVPGCTGSYSIDGGSTWKPGTSVTFNANGTVVAKNTDGTNKVTASTQTIGGIDPSAPTSSTNSYTKTTNSITVTASGTDEQSGIKMYSFKVDNGSWTSWQSSAIYTFSGLSTGNHTIQSKVYNGTYGSAGATEAKGALASLLVSSTSTVTLSGCSAPTMSVSPSGSTWAQYKTVTINGTSGFTTYYSTNGGSSWIEGSSVTITTNNTNVIARVSDGTNTCNSTSTLTVTNIDGTVPTAATISSSSITSSSFIITAGGTDGESGIARYNFSKDGGSTWTGWQTSNVYTFTGLSSSTTYTTKVKVYNGTYGSTGASETYGVKESSTLSVKTSSACPTPTMSVSPSGSTWSQNKTVTINYGNVPGCTGSYSKNNGSWTSGSSVTFTANGNVVARNVDSAGNSVTATQTVSYIDTTTPSASLTVTSNGSTITSGGIVSTTTYASLSCSNAGESGIGGYYIEVRDSVYSTLITSTTSSSLSFNPASSTSGNITISGYCTSGAGKQSSTQSQTVVYSGSSSSSCTPYSSCGSCPYGYSGSKYYNSSCNCVDNCYYSSTPSTPTCTVGASCGSCSSGYTGGYYYDSSCNCVNQCTYSGGGGGSSSSGSECTNGQTKSVETLGCSENCKSCIRTDTCSNGYWQIGWKECTEYWPSCSGSNPNGTTCSSGTGTRTGCWCTTEGIWKCTCSK